MRFDRCRELFGGEAFEKLQSAGVIVLGVGGVGSYVLDCLYRSGIGRITIVDYDIYEESNRNRQIGSDAVGACKVTTLSGLYPGIETIRTRMDIEWVESFDFDPYDVVVDASDTTRVKIEIAKKCHEKLIMSLGSAGRVDASMVRSDSIWRSHGDALGRKLRNELRKSAFSEEFRVVYSPEPTVAGNRGSFVGVTGTFGLMICSEAVKMILKN